jgi:hypothetical protein
MMGLLTETLRLNSLTSYPGRSSRTRDLEKTLDQLRRDGGPSQRAAG